MKQEIKMKVQGTQLAAVMNKNETSKAIVLDLGKRQRIRHYLDMNRHFIRLMSKGQKVVREDYTATFKEFESLGLGKVVEKKNSINFEFYTSLINIAQAAEKGQDLDFTPNTQEAPKQKSKQQPKARGRGRPRKQQTEAAAGIPVPSKDSNVLVVPLRTDFVRIKVPKDLSNDEASLISKAILSLTKAG